MKKKNWTRSLACFLAGLSALTLSGCDELLNELLSGVYDEISASTSDGNDDAQSREDGEKDETPLPPVTPDEPVVTPEPEEPNPEKELAYEETDALGHKIAYYTDGSWEDLGRTVALDFSTPAPQTQYGYTYFSGLEKGEGLCNFYVDLYNAATQFHYYGEDLSVNEEGAHVIGQVEYAKYGLTGDEAIGVWKTFVTENPLYFWFDNAIMYTSKALILIAEESYALAETRQQICTDIREMALDCDKYLNGKISLTERALTIYDYLTERVEYAYETDGKTPETEIWAHNIVGATQGKGVCETYAKTYDYLCGLFDLQCINVVGTAVQDGVSGGHAWNILELENEWYCVDVTWADQTQLTREWFGKRATEFMTTHVADTEYAFGIQYQYELPKLASVGLCPVLFGEEKGEKTMEKSIDAAFAKMQNGQGRYEITLYPDTKLTQEKGLELSWEGAAFASALPQVEHITFIGRYRKESLVTYYLAGLQAGEISLQCDVTLQNVRLDYDKLIKNGYMLTKNNG